VVHRVFPWGCLAVTLLFAGAADAAMKPGVSVVPKGIQSAVPGAAAEAKFSMLQPETPAPEQKAPGFVRVTPVTNPEPLPLSGQTISSMILMATPSPMATEAPEQSARAAVAVPPRVRPKPIARSKRMVKPMAREEERLPQLRVPWWRQLLSLRLP
jgi:hypothetical protein